MKRPILIAIIGYIIGILWGLYLEINIALFYVLIIVIYLIYKRCITFFNININSKKTKIKMFSMRRYSRYLKLIIKQYTIIIIAIFSIISNLIINFQEYRYEQIYKKEGDIEFIGIIYSNKEKKQYYNKYKIKVIKSFSNKEFEYKHLYINIKEELKYGDLVRIKGKYLKPKGKRNYGGFNYQEYLKTKKIYGIIEVSNYKILEHEKAHIIMMISNKISLQIKENINNIFNQEEAELIKGLLIGDVSNIDEKTKENFKIANISHILAISGMHINYIIIGTTKILDKKIGKRSTKITVIIILIIYMFITGFSASVIRASIMGIIAVFSNLIYRKNDTLTSISISLFCILIYNPYLIMNVGLQLSYIGTVGIIIFNQMNFHILNNMKIKRKRYKKKESKILKRVKEILSVSISAQVTLLPIILYHFNICGPYFIITNFLISVIIGPIIILGFIFIIISFISLSYASILKVILSIGVQILIYISKMSHLPFSKIYIKTPSLVYICLYMCFVIIIKNIYFVYHSKKMTVTQLRVRNLIALIKYKVNSKKEIFFKILIICIFSILCFNSNIISNKLKINFVDVGQGDCTFIITPKKKTILIDGGGSEHSTFDVGKKVLIPYILDKGYTQIDYMFISHFDSDHVRGIISVLEELKVKNIIIGKQFENTYNLQVFLEIVNAKNIKISVAEAGSRIHIEKNLYFDVLWPSTTQEISENSINNNALVCKLNYKNFNMLFTGDIEEEAEKVLVSKYGGTNILKSVILKVAHHGSKSSSIKEFLNLAQPRIAFIGVGENNLYGHPNSDVLTRLTNLRCEDL